MHDIIIQYHHQFNKNKKTKILQKKHQKIQEKNHTSSFIATIITKIYIIIKSIINTE